MNFRKGEGNKPILCQTSCTPSGDKSRFHSRVAVLLISRRHLCLLPTMRPWPVKLEFSKSCSSLTVSYCRKHTLICENCATLAGAFRAGITQIISQFAAMLRLPNLQTFQNWRAIISKGGCEMQQSPNTETEESQDNSPRLHSGLTSKEWGDKVAQEILHSLNSQEPYQVKQLPIPKK